MERFDRIPATLPQPRSKNGTQVCKNTHYAKAGKDFTLPSDPGGARTASDALAAPFEEGNE
jgi:hypothetical protein